MMNGVMETHSETHGPRRSSSLFLALPLILRGVLVAGAAILCFKIEIGFLSDVTLYNNPNSHFRHGKRRRRFSFGL